MTHLFGVLSLSGMLGDILGLVPVLNIAAITGLTGLIALLFLPTKAETPRMAL